MIESKRTCSAHVDSEQYDNNGMPIYTEPPVYEELRQDENGEWWCPRCTYNIVGLLAYYSEDEVKKSKYWNNARLDKEDEAREALSNRSPAHSVQDDLYRPGRITYRGAC